MCMGKRRWCIYNLSLYAFSLFFFFDKAASSVNVKDVTICINLRCVCARRFVVRVQGGIWE